MARMRATTTATVALTLMALMAMLAGSACGSRRLEGANSRVGRHLTQTPVGGGARAGREAG
jgi:hypothetical protein